MTMTATDQIAFTLTSLSERQLFDSPLPQTKHGSCNYATRLSLGEIIHFLQGDITPQLLSASQLSSLVRVQNGELSLESVPASYRALYEKWTRNWASPDNVNKDKPLPIKAALPAVVPSIHILNSRNNLLPDYRSQSVKRLINILPDLWEHTGLFGIDIDRGKAGNSHDPAKLLAMAREKLSSLPGFVFAYTSPNKGIKAFFRASDEIVHYLNNPKSLDTPEPVESEIQARKVFHEAVYEELVRQIAEVAHVEMDSTCKDIARLQFLYRGEYIAPAEGASPVFTIENMEKFFREAMERGVDSYIADNLLSPAEPLPPLLLEFAQWLDLQGRPKEAETIRNMKPGKDKAGSPARVAYCPCCEGICTTQRGENDLALYIPAGDPVRSRFTCFHDTCKKDSDTAKRIPGFRSMAQLFYDFRLSRVRRRAETASCVVSTGHPDLDRLYNPPQIVLDALKGRWDLSLGSTLDIKDPDSVASMDFPVTKEKSSSIPATALNIKALMGHLNLVPIHNKVAQTTLVIDSASNKAYTLAGGLTGPLTDFWVSYLDKSAKSLPIQKEIESVVANAAYQNLYHPIATLTRLRPWDGEDRLSAYNATLVLDSGRCPSGWEPAAWLDYVLRTWLYTLYGRLEGHIKGTRKLLDSYCPILIGPQGCGKTTWCDQLFWPFDGCYSSRMATDAKDLARQKGTLVAIQLNEIDKLLSDREQSSQLKDTLDNFAEFVRFAFAKEPSTVYPCASFIGSTNENHPLSDVTGNRRFSLLYVKSAHDDARLDFATRAGLDLQQIWAQIREEYIREAPRLSERVGLVVKLSKGINDTYGIMESPEAAYACRLRYVDWAQDTDINGEPLWKHTYPHMKCPSNLLNALTRIDKTGVPVIDMPSADIKLTKAAVRDFSSALIRVYGPNAAEAKQKVGEARSRRMPYLLADDWIKWASSETKERWYNKFPEWREQDEQKRDALL